LKCEETQKNASKRVEKQPANTSNPKPKNNPKHQEQKLASAVNLSLPLLTLKNLLNPKTP
jgi:hypothetical protein